LNAFDRPVGKTAVGRGHVEGVVVCLPLPLERR
jgi:hypothetical protein